MSGQSHLAALGDLVEHRKTGTFRAAIASRMARLRFAWERQVSSRRLARSIAHLDDRLLADIGLSAKDLGFAERVARGRAANI
jgi:uncharacterized protein YjiS (DUF1127 family)